MGLGSGSSGFNLLLSKFGYTRLPKSNEEQPLISQDYHHYYQFQTQEDEDKERTTISSLEKKHAYLDNEIRRINSSIYNLESAIHSTSWIDIVNLCVKPMQKELAQISSRVAKLEKASTPKSVDIATSSNTPIQKELSELKAKVAKLDKTHLTTPMLKKDEAIRKLQQNNVVLEKKLEDLTTSVQLLKSKLAVPDSLVTHASSSSQTIGSEVRWHPLPYYSEVDKLFGNRDDLQVASALIFFLVSFLIGYCFV